MNRICLLSFFSLASSLIINGNSGAHFVFEHQTAEFGLQQPYNVSGNLVITGTSGCVDYQEPSKYWGAIILVEDGGCEYAIKARKAMLVNAKGLIVAAQDDKLVKMTCTMTAEYCDSITIPAVFVSGTTRVEISDAAAKFSPLTAIINQDGEHSNDDKKHKLTFFLVVLLIIPIAWCVMVAITLVFKVCSRLATRQIRRQEVRQIPDIPYTLISANADDEEKGKAAAERKDDDQPINETCVICLEDFKAGQRIKVLPCGHGFHGECIDPWLRERSDQCPICKRSVLTGPDRHVCFCIPLERCRACCIANQGNLSPRVTQMIMLLVVAFLAVIVALFFLYPSA